MNEIAENQIEYEQKKIKCSQKFGVIQYTRNYKSPLTIDAQINNGCQECKATNGSVCPSVRLRPPAQVITLKFGAM